MAPARLGALLLGLTLAASSAEATDFTGVTSVVFLDRFTIAHPQLSSLAGGRFDGTWPEGGSVSVQTPGLVSGPVMVVDVTSAGGATASGPAWLTGIEPLPALWAKTSYLWTVSDPLLAAVNGEDALPDLAIGRLPAATVEQAQMLVDKLIAWEDSGQGLAGQATLVADNPDIAGDFEADVRDIARSYLAGRSDLLLLRELGAGTRPAIQDALNSGLSYLSYVGHGGAAVWASENVWNSWDAASLQAQSRQPLLLTMNCLNGYFVAPAFDSLAESLLKVEGRGAIASFSPSGLSEDGPAHQYHRALMAELTNGRQARLGDAVLAAQKAYAQTGLMPELLSVYQLLGDPAMRIR